MSRRSLQAIPRVRHVTGKAPLTLLYSPPVVARGIKRQRVDRTGTAAKLPLTERHEQVLAVLGSEPVGATALGKLCELSGVQVTSACYALQARGLAERVPGQGWRRA